MAKFNETMAPDIPDDDGAPLVRPTTIKVATVFAVLAGAIYLTIGSLSMLTVDGQIEDFRKLYAAYVQTCNDNLGGIGSAIPLTPTPAIGATPTVDLNDLAAGCRQLTTATPETERLAGFRQQIVIYSAIIMAMGTAALAGGIYLPRGQKWARRVLIGVASVALILALLFQIANTPLLAATMLLAISIFLCYVGKGGVYFGLLAARRAKH